MRLEVEDVVGIPIGVLEEVLYTPNRFLELCALSARMYWCISDACFAALNRSVIRMYAAPTSVCVEMSSPSLKCRAMAESSCRRAASTFVIFIRWIVEPGLISTPHQ